jgi:DNA-binding CsgD family transcriptional regulator
MAAALDRLAAGVLLVDASGALAWGNRRSLALLAEADGIALDRHGRLHAPTETAGEALRRTLAIALAGEGAATPLPRPSGRPALAVLAVPLPPQAAPPRILPAPPGARVMLLLIDFTQGGVDAALEGRLRILWGLTAAEAVVAAQTAHGAGLPEVAHALGLAVTTARTHAQRVFAKAGLRGQTELARQVERLSLLASAGPPAASGAPPHTPTAPPAIA